MVNAITRKINYKKFVRVNVLLTHLRDIVIVATTRRQTKGMNEMSRNFASHKSNVVVLKSIIDDAMNDKTIIDDNAKRIRAKLRATFRDDHVKNTSWIATTSREYDRIRCAFDARYAERVANARKRKSKSNAKNNAQSNVETTNAE